MFAPFFYLLRDLGIPVSFQYIMEFYAALQKGLVTDLDRLFLVARLIFIKRVEHFDMFERAFAAYFLGQTDRLQIPHVEGIFQSKPFQDWLQKQIAEGNIDPQKINDLPLDELLRRFWETLLAQQEEHHGGNRWVGTGGTSPWGHSGKAKGGIRVHGRSQNRSAMKVLGQRYIDYSAESTLSADNIRQALAMMKRMVPVGPSTEINIDETINRTCKNGGEIELVFQRELRNKIKVILLLDNGGYSMNPFIDIVRLLFLKMRDQFKDLEFYYFHNCVYDCVYSDIYHSKRYELQKILQKDKATRLFIVGDANMGPYELFSPYGAINYYIQNRVPGIDYLKLIAQTFPYSVWLNPIEREYWKYESPTISAISNIFHMQELTIQGLKNAVEYLKEKE